MRRPGLQGLQGLKLQAGGDGNRATMQRILIIEDHADIRRLIQLTLEFDDYEIHEEPDGERGLAAARRLQPDVILLDVMMPGRLDGLLVCRQLRADPALARSKVVMLSARGTAADIEMGLSAGADVYLVKPFSPLQLVDVLERLGRGEPVASSGEVPA